MIRIGYGGLRAFRSRLKRQPSDRPETEKRWGKVPQSAFDDAVRRFLEAQKEISGAIRWRSKSNRDYEQASMLVTVVDGTTEGGILKLTSNTTLAPPKYGFALLFRGFRVLGLDVDPARTHFNARTRTIVRSTHWQRWPDMEAEPDGRNLNHQGWLRALCEAARITDGSVYKAPPAGGEQLDLLL